MSGPAFSEWTSAGPGTESVMPTESPVRDIMIEIITHENTRTTAFDPNEALERALNEIRQGLDRIVAK